jgi:hypothetical protein
VVIARSVQANQSLVMNTMRQFRINRTNALMLGLVMAGACGVSYGADVPLVFGNEDIAPFSAMQITKTSGEPGSTTTLRVQRPTLCGKVTANAVPGFVNQINPVFAGVNGSGDFKFGSLSGGSQGAVPGIGYWNFRPNGLTIQSDSETLCYVLDADGVRKASAGLFNDSFDDGNSPDSSITTSVAALPSFSNAYYTYYVDVRIPAEFSGMGYRVRDGFDSSVFTASGMRHCQPLPIGATQCDVGTMIYNNLDLPLQVPPGGVSQRFIVQRPLAVGAQMPADTSLAVTYAALFLPDGAENKLGNNVSAGRGTLSDLAPIITAASNMVPVMAEGTGATNLSFVLSDDTNETGLPALNAAVAIDFNGTLVNAPNVSCAQLDPPQSGEVVRRTCRFDIPVFNPDFATDSNPATPGTYAPGVHASVLITATDSRGIQSTKTVPFHIVSGDNDAPTFTLTPLAMSGREDPTPVVTCDLGIQPFPAQCLGEIADFVTDMRGGPALAYDENAVQMPFFAGVGGDGKLSCTGTTPSIFATIVGGQQSPRVTVNGTSARLSYLLSTVPGTAECTIYLGAFDPTGGFTYSQTVRTFRIEVLN